MPEGLPFEKVVSALFSVVRVSPKHFIGNSFV